MTTLHIPFTPTTMFHKYSQYQIHSKFNDVFCAPLNLHTAYNYTVQKGVSNILNILMNCLVIMSFQKIVPKELVRYPCLHCNLELIENLPFPLHILSTFFLFPPHDKFKSLSLLFSLHFRTDIKAKCSATRSLFFHLQKHHFYLGASFLWSVFKD
jgi:hypothetical protein